jgi:hypothetical protein
VWRFHGTSPHNKKMDSRFRGHDNFNKVVLEMANQLSEDCK